MPLLMCPNCDASMQAVQRASVEFDMCPKCRGVWLDRGELEKLMALGREDAPPPTPSAAPFGRPPEPRRETYEPRRETYEHRRDHDDDDYRRHGHKKKRLDLFDIFD